MCANFHEKALFVKADLAASVWPSVTGPALRAMLPSALSVSQLSVTRCIIDPSFRTTKKALQSSQRSLLLVGVDQVRNCAVALC